MSDPSFLFACAGIAMSFAAFAGLINALQPGQERLDAVELFRLNVIVMYAFTALFAALGAIPLGALLGEGSAIRLLSLGLLTASVSFGGYQVWADGTIGKNAGVSLAFRFMVFVTATLGVLLFLAAVFTATIVAFELGLLMLLAMPALTFGYVVAHLRPT